MSKLDIIIADDHRLFRKGLVSLLTDFEIIDSIREAGNGKEVIKLMRKSKADIILMDLNMPVMDGIEASKNIIRRYPNTKILVLTMHEDKKFIAHLLEIGVHGYLLKNAEPEEVEEAILMVYEKDFHYNRLVTEVLREGFIGKAGIKPSFVKPIDLTTREVDILSLICKEFTNKEIADRLSLSKRTVEKIRSNLLEKIDAKNTVGLVRYALQNNIYVQ